MLVTCLVLAGCDSGPSPEQQAVAHALTWFEAAHDGQRDDRWCHGLGLLKHPTFSCAEYLEQAAGITLASRSVSEITPMDCYQDVCGRFFQLEVDGMDSVGNETKELLLLKQDDGVMRVYWYRSNEMLRAQQIAQEQREEADKDPIQAAYDALTNRYPSLYEYPPCLQLRASSTTLMADPVALEEIDPAVFDALAETCSAQMCITTVGRKYAALCPPSP